MKGALPAPRPPHAEQPPDATEQRLRAMAYTRATPRRAAGALWNAQAASAIGTSGLVSKIRAIMKRGEAALSALDTALSAIDAPAFIVDLGGAVLHANSNAQALLARDRHGVARSLAQAIAGTPADLPWDLTPLRGTAYRRGFLAILREPRRDVTTAGADAICAAINRWRLTPRQAQVLELVSRGYTNALIADDLGIGEGTVEFHLSAIFDKAGVDTRAKLIILMLQL